MRSFHNTLWAIDESLLPDVRAAHERQAQGLAHDDECAKKLTPKQDERIAQADGAVAVFGIHGLMQQHGDWLLEVFGGTATGPLGAAITAASLDASIKHIILHVDSPGGSVYGMQELAERIRDARQHKRVIAQVNSFAASAAYWAASQADEVIVSPGGDVGSIGVYATHRDYSQAMEEAGVKTTYIYAGKYKVEGNPDEPISEEAVEHMQARVDEMYRAFVNDVAAGRGVDTKTVLSEFGQGRMVSADKAAKVGMVDRVATFSATLSRFVGTQSNANNNAIRRRKLALHERE